MARASESALLSALVDTQRLMVSANLDTQSVLSVVLDRIHDLTRADAAVIVLYVDGRLTVGAASGPDDVGVRFQIASQRSMVRRAFESGASILNGHLGLAIPLEDARHRVGVLFCASPRADAFTTGDIQTLELLAGLAGPAIAQAQAFERTARRGDRYAALARIARAGLAEITPEELRAQVTSVIERALGAPVRITDTDEVVPVEEVADRTDSDFLAAASAILAEAGRRRTVEDELRLSRERLSAIVDTMAAGVLIFDAGARITFANGSAERMLKRPRRSLIGRDRRTARIRPHHVDGRPMKDDEDFFNRLAASKEPIVDEAWRLLRPDRTFLDVTVNAAAVRNAAGAITAVVVSLIDGSERRRVEGTLRESEERLRAIVSSAFDAIVAVDGEARIVEFNPAAEAIFGRSRAEVLGQPAQLLLPQRLRGAFAAAFQRRLAAPTKEFSGRMETVGARGDGTEFGAQVSVTGLTQRGRPMYVASVRPAVAAPRVSSPRHSG